MRYTGTGGTGLTGANARDTEDSGGVTVTNDAVGQVLRDYLSEHPEDRARLVALIGAVEGPAAGSSRLTWRKTLPGHVTCSALAVNAAGRVLLIRHRASSLWLQPGGHVEDGDRSLFGAALRELAEETGIGRRRVRPILNRPVDVDVHWIPANDGKREAEHLHYDFRFLLSVDGASISAPVDRGDPKPTGLMLQDAEIADARWGDVTELGGRLAERVRAALLAGPDGR